MSEQDLDVYELADAVFTKEWNARLAPRDTPHDPHDAAWYAMRAVVEAVLARGLSPSTAGGES